VRKSPSPRPCCSQEGDADDEDSDIEFLGEFVCDKKGDITSSSDELALNFSINFLFLLQCNCHFLDALDKITKNF
jgi:hypothetical protein